MNESSIKSGCDLARKIVNVSGTTRSRDGETLRAMTYLVYAQTMAKERCMIVIERAQHSLEGPVFPSLTREIAQTITNAGPRQAEEESALWTGIHEQGYPKATEAMIITMLSNAVEALQEVWKGCGIEPYDEKRFGTLSDTGVVNDGVYSQGALRNWGELHDVQTTHTTHSVIVVKKPRGKTRCTRTHLQPYRGRDIDFEGMLIGEARAPYKQCRLYETQGKNFVITDETRTYAGGWEIQNVNIGKAWDTPGELSAQLGTNEVRRALIEHTAPEAFFGHVLEEEPNSKIVWTESGAMYIGAPEVGSAKVDEGTSTMYKTEGGRIAIVTDDRNRTFPRIERFENENEIAQASSSHKHIRQLCKETGVETTMWIA